MRALEARIYRGGCHLPVAVACTSLAFRPQLVPAMTRRQATYGRWVPARGNTEAGWVCGRGPADRWGLGGGPAGRGLDSLRCPSPRGGRRMWVWGAGPGCRWARPGHGAAAACCHRAGLTRVAARPVWSRLDGSWMNGAAWAVGASHAGASQLMGHVGGASSGTAVCVNDG